jgi:hypothetical protein
MIRAQNFAQRLHRRPCKRVARAQCVSPNLSPLSTTRRHLLLIPARQANIPTTPLAIKVELNLKSKPETFRAERIQQFEKREAVKDLTTSLLRSQQIVPTSPTFGSLTELQKLEEPDVHELLVWMELQRWLRYFSRRSQEKMHESTETNVSEIRIVESTAKRDQTKAQTDVNTTEAMSTQRSRSIDRKERKKQVPSFFDRPSRAHAHSDLHAAIKEENHVKAMRLYHSKLQSKQELDTHVLNALFSLLTSQQQPFTADTILRHYLTIIPSDAKGVHTSLYYRLCDSMRCMDPIKHNYHEIHKLTRSVVHRVLKLDHDGQQCCIPVLVSALAMQRATRVGHFARRLYDHMIDKGFTVTDGYWEHLLSLSKYNRRQDLPYAEILQRSVAVGWRPSPSTVLHALENMYPFTETSEACVAMKAIADLQRYKPSDGQQYIIDLATLECLSSAATQTANLEMTMLVWELIDVFNYAPSLALYENTVVAFASHRQTYANAFVVMNEMKAKGLDVPRALIRGVSSQLRCV